MICLDTNLLVYAHRSGTAEHGAAQQAIETACAARDGCGIALPTVSEFFSLVTHSTASGRPSTADEARRFIAALEEDGGLCVFTPGPAFAARLLQTAVDLGLSGARIFDLQIALCALDGGATELWSHNQHFVKVPGLRVHDPLAKHHDH